MSVDPRARWSRTAEGWGARADEMARATMPVSTWMVEALAPQPGDTILELAAGPGDTGFLAAELIQPGGTLICSDLVPEMLTVAQRRAAALGIRNVRFRQIDMQLPIDQPAASLDGVLCRWGYMLLADPEAALRETRRILKPGARVTLAAWTAREENPWSALPLRELVERGLAEPPDPAAPGQFSWGREGVIAEHLEAAGFVEHVVERIAFQRPHPSVDAWLDAAAKLSFAVGEATSGMDAATRADVLAGLAQRAARFTAPDGSLVLPAATWVAAAGA